MLNLLKAPGPIQRNFVLDAPQVDVYIIDTPLPCFSATEMPGILRLPRQESGNDEPRFPTRAASRSDDDNQSSGDPMVEVGSDEFPSYFIERRARLFSSNPTPYPFPVDTPEQERSTFLHDILRQIHGTNCIGPVPEVLEMNTERQKRVLDVCTGNGIWALQMATEFPHAYFIGFDNVPLATRYPPSNLRFEIEDVNGNYHWPDESFDMVHARDTNLAVLDHRAAIEEMARVLRPEGLFISIEWGHFVALHPPIHADISTHAPASCRFFNAVNQVLRSARNPHPIAPNVALLLSNSAKFGDISANRHYVPIGSWPTDASLRRIGEANLRAQERYADSVRYLLLDASWEERDVEQLIADYVYELRSVDGMATVCYTVYGRKL